MPIDRDLQEQLRRVLTSLEQLLPKPVDKIDWATCHAANWRRQTFAGKLDPVASVDGIELGDLLGIDEQKRVVEANTRQLLAGYPANNVLLWGTRGTGKSSLVRALLKAYAPQGLRVIQVDRDDLVSLPAIVDEIRGEPYRFILFADDVSFELGESSYKMLKSALDGSVYAPPENALIYVTSNRRHMLPEYETDNLGALVVRNEIHHGEAVEENLALGPLWNLGRISRLFAGAILGRRAPVGRQALREERREARLDPAGRRGRGGVGQSKRRPERPHRVSIRGPMGRRESAARAGEGRPVTWRWGMPGPGAAWRGLLRSARPMPVRGRDGSLYIAETNGHRIRRVGPDGVISRVAGTGVQGDGGPPKVAQLDYPFEGLRQRPRAAAVRIHSNLSSTASVRGEPGAEV